MPKRQGAAENEINFKEILWRQGNVKNRIRKRHKMTIDVTFNMFMVAVCEKEAGRE